MPSDVQAELHHRLEIRASTTLPILRVSRQASRCVARNVLRAARLLPVSHECFASTYARGYRAAFYKRQGIFCLQLKIITRRTSCPFTIRTGLRGREPRPLIP